MITVTIMKNRHMITVTIMKNRHMITVTIMKNRHMITVRYRLTLDTAVGITESNTVANILRSLAIILSLLWSHVEYGSIY
jgi:hypothetical protein